jgi:23S rRNA pseudouridine2605 synthase
MPTNDDEAEEKGPRIAKFMASAGLCSRRDAERWISDGRVRVNGNTLDTPAFLVTSDDVIEVDGKKIGVQGDALPRLWLYHKPKYVMTTHNDPEGRPTVFEALPNDMPRVVSVGRLDLNSEGLLLLTTSGALARELELPKNSLKRTYRVRVNGMPSEKHLHMMSGGVTVEDVYYQPFHIIVEDEKSGRNQWLSVTLKEGKNREIRRVFEYFKYPVSRLIRVAYGEFELGDLAAGDTREVPPAQVEALMEQMGLA